MSWLLPVVGAEYVLRWLPRGTHRWRRAPKSAELDVLLARGDLQIKRRSGVRFYPNTRRLSMTGIVGVHYMLFAAKPDGSAAGMEDVRRAQVAARVQRGVGG